MDRAITVARFTQVMRRWVCAAAVLSSSRISGTKVHRTYVGRLERGEGGVTAEALAAILAALEVSLAGRHSPANRSTLHAPPCVHAATRNAWVCTPARSLSSEISLSRVSAIAPQRKAMRHKPQCCTSELISSCSLRAHQSPHLYSLHPELIPTHSCYPITSNIHSPPTGVTMLRQDSTSSLLSG